MLTYVWAYSTPHLDPSVQSNGPLYHIPCFLLGSCSLRVDESSVIDDTSCGGSSGDQIRKERSFRNNLTRLCHSLDLPDPILIWKAIETPYIGHSLVRGVSKAIKMLHPTKEALRSREALCWGPEKCLSEFCGPSLPRQRGPGKHHRNERFVRFIRDWGMNKSIKRSASQSNTEDIDFGISYRISKHSSLK